MHLPSVIISSNDRLLLKLPFKIRNRHLEAKLSLHKMPTVKSPSEGVMLRQNSAAPSTEYISTPREAWLQRRLSSRAYEFTLVPVNAENLVLGHRSVFIGCQHLGVGCVQSIVFTYYLFGNMKKLVRKCARGQRSAAEVCRQGNLYLGGRGGDSTVGRMQS